MEWLKKINKKLLVATAVFFVGFITFSVGLATLGTFENFAYLLNVLGAIELLCGIVGLLFCWADWAEHG